MELIKKYTAIQVRTKSVDLTLEPVFSYGEVEGPHYSLTYPETEFDTEEEAIEYAYNKNQYAEWLIIPKISFKNY